LDRQALIEALLSATTSQEVAEEGARGLAPGAADAVLLYRRLPDQDAHRLRAVAGLPEGVVEAGRTQPQADGWPRGAAAVPLTQIPDDSSWAPIAAAARQVGFQWGARRSLPGRRGEEGCVVALWRSAEAPPLEELTARVALVAPAFRRALADDRARLERNLFRLMLPLLSDGVLVSTTDGELMHYNARLQEMVGWSAAEVRRQGWTNLVYADPGERAQVARAIGALVMGRPSMGTERSLTCKDGQRRQVAIWSAAVPDAAGGAPALLGVLKDVSERADRQREEGLARLGQLAGSVAHDLNNVLCAVMGHAELMGMPGLGPEELLRHADTVLSAAERGADLARQLLLFSGASSARPVPLDPAVEVSQAVRLFEHGFDGDLSIALEVEEELPAVEFDPGQLHQVLGNLLANARDAGGAGTVRVRVGRAALPPNTRFRAPDGPEPGHEVVLIRVADSGPGFSEAALQNLFQPFFTSKPHGHGLGMAAIHSAAAANRAAVHVWNRAGSRPGAVVDLYLPLSERPERAHALLAAAYEGGGRRIWLADRQRQVLEFSQISLRAHGYEVEAFDSREALLAAASAGPPPDAAVIDASVLDDAEPFFHALGGPAPLLWLSGGARPPKGGGLEGFLQKPYTGQDLRAELARLLERG
jgi:PAS domain S-box-containing protein